MAAITIADKPCSAVRVTIPRQGAWTADVSLARADDVTGTVALRIGKRTMVGTVRRAALYGGQRRLLMVGGYDGWRRVIPARSYSHAAGVRKSTVLKDAARECGEKIAIAADRVVGAHWWRIKAPASDQLAIFGEAWWVDDAGVTQTGPRLAGRISSAFTVSARDGSAERTEVATEAFEDWSPGRSFASPQTPDEQTISMVTIDARDGQSPRVSVLTGPTDRDRMLGDFRAIVHQETARYALAGMWTYEIVSATPNTVDALPLEKDRVPPVKDCPMLPGLVGEEVTPAPGSKCYVVFADLNPARPYVAHIEGTALKLKITAAMIELGNGVIPVAVAGDFAGPFPIVAALALGRLKA